MRSVSPPVSTETTVTSPSGSSRWILAAIACFALGRQPDVARPDADDGGFACCRRLAGTFAKRSAPSGVSRAAPSCADLALEHVHVRRADLAGDIEIAGVS